MQLSRRSFFRLLTFGTTATVATGPLATLSSAAMFEPSRSVADSFIHLDSNENPYGASQKCIYAMQDSLSASNRYPFREYDALMGKIAEHHGIPAEQILLGCGSTEILRVAPETYGGPGRQVMQASPTFEAIGHYAQLAGAEVVSVPLARQFAHDLDAMLARITPSTTLIYICNPNNPTGSLTPRQDLESFLSKLPSHCHVLIDEAYHHFVSPNAPYTSFIDQPMRDERIIVCRTFSKVYGLAGLRLGYAVAAKDVVKRMEPYITQDSINSIVTRVGVVALGDTKDMQETIKKNAAVRLLFLEQAKARNLSAIDSQANFAMIDTGRPVDDVISHFRQNNILVGRKFSAMPNYLRVSFGKPDDMQTFWRVWDTLPGSIPG
jgi:histidinol-phosphate aminotransferase